MFARLIIQLSESLAREEAGAGLRAQLEAFRLELDK